MTVWAKSDQVVISMSVALRPRNNMMDIYFNVSASRDRASMASLDKNSSPKLGW
jgi:hypothetical protein